MEVESVLQQMATCSAVLSIAQEAAKADEAELTRRVQGRAVLDRRRNSFAAAAESARVEWTARRAKADEAEFEFAAADAECRVRLDLLVAKKAAIQETLGVVARLKDSIKSTTHSKSTQLPIIENLIPTSTSTSVISLEAPRAFAESIGPNVRRRGVALPSQDSLFQTSSAGLMCKTIDYRPRPYPPRISKDYKIKKEACTQSVSAYRNEGQRRLSRVRGEKEG
ncbi:hypothetical protein HDU79_002093 [Rhizoclosmatium sp. JEL0117]|nr:hypothetical protein HDU79_002093 [Rhizoclosmatium sp. JEL0117]